MGTEHPTLSYTPHTWAKELPLNWREKKNFKWYLYQGRPSWKDPFEIHSRGVSTGASANHSRRANPGYYQKRHPEGKQGKPLLYMQTQWEGYDHAPWSWMWHLEKVSISNHLFCCVIRKKSPNLQWLVWFWRKEGVLMHTLHKLPKTQRLLPPVCKYTTHSQLKATNRPWTTQFFPHSSSRLSMWEKNLKSRKTNSSWAFSLFAEINCGLKQLKQKTEDLGEESNEKLLCPSPSGV